MDCKKMLPKLGLLAAGVMLSGCALMAPEAGKQDVVAKRTTGAITVDGKLNEMDWGKTPAYNLTLARESYERLPEAMKKNFPFKLHENGKVRLLWDDKNLYVGIEFDDTDVVAEGTEDQLHHYLMGDVAEVFIKPEKDTWYWEIYATPANFKSSYFFEGRGLLGLPSGFDKDKLIKGMKTGAVVNGTLNKSRDKDKGWSAEIAIPIAQLSKSGTPYACKFGVGEPWKIFFGRYNYNRYLAGRENSSFPNQQQTNYHVLEEYGNLKLEK